MFTAEEDINVPKGLSSGDDEIRLSEELAIRQVDNGYVITGGRRNRSNTKVFTNIDDALKSLKEHFKELDIQIKTKKLKE